VQQGRLGMPAALGGIAAIPELHHRVVTIKRYLADQVGLLIFS